MALSKRTNGNDDVVVDLMAKGVVGADADVASASGPTIRRHERRRGQGITVRRSSLLLVTFSIAVLSSLSWMRVEAFTLITKARQPSLMQQQPTTKSFTLGRRWGAAQRVNPPPAPFATLHALSSDGDEDDETPQSPAEAASSNDPKTNPYADPNYPELEFIDYSDPNYSVDQGVSDEFFDGARATSVDEQEQQEEEGSTEEQIEAMREERRRKNDEFQFQTYYKDVCRDGAEYLGEWTVYKTSTFLGEGGEAGVEAPNVFRAGQPLKVKSRGYKATILSSSPFPVDGERIIHEEVLVTNADDDVEVDAQHRAIEEEIIANTYWPDQLGSYDFRGQQGTMIVGNGYTISSAVPLLDNDDGSETEPAKTTPGPYAKYNAELGIQSDLLRMRIKLDYSVLEHEIEQYEQKQRAPPILHLKSLTVCRETKEMWPPKNGVVEKETTTADLDTLYAASEALFGVPGADGGLYDPPPVGTDDQATKYMSLDLEGRATVLFPYQLDQGQDPDEGWVTSLDWTPGRLRYQVDRKVKGGADILGLRTLELSEVQSADAEEYRPRDGGSDMRQ